MMEMKENRIYIYAFILKNSKKNYPDIHDIW